MKKLILICISVCLVLAVTLSLVACEWPWDKLKKDKEDSKPKVTTLSDAAAYAEAIAEVKSGSVTMSGRLSGNAMDMGGAITVKRLPSGNSHALIVTEKETQDLYCEFVAKNSWRVYKREDGEWFYSEKAYSDVEALLEIFVWPVFDVASFADYTYQESSKSYTASVSNTAYGHTTQYTVSLKFEDGHLVYQNLRMDYDDDTYSACEITYSDHGKTTVTLPSASPDPFITESRFGDIENGLRSGNLTYHVEIETDGAKSNVVIKQKPNEWSSVAVGEDYPTYYDARGYRLKVYTYDPLAHAYNVTEEEQSQNGALSGLDLFVFDVYSALDYSDLTYDKASKSYKANVKVKIGESNEITYDVTLRFENGKVVEQKVRRELDGELTYDLVATLDNYGTTEIEYPAVD